MLTPTLFGPSFHLYRMSLIVYPTEKIERPPAVGTYLRGSPQTRFSSEGASTYLAPPSKPQQSPLSLFPSLSHYIHTRVCLIFFFFYFHFLYSSCDFLLRFEYVSRSRLVIIRSFLHCSFHSLFSPLSICPTSFVRNL